MNSKRTNLTRLTVAGSTVALFAGLAVPAYACIPSDPSDPAKSVSHASHPVALTLDGLKAKVDTYVAERLAELAAKAAKVAASSKLTAAQKADAQARIAAEAAALDALKTKVDGETSVTAIQTDLQAARLSALKARVDARIDARLAHLAAALTRVQSSTTLSDAEKAKAEARIQAKIAALTALKAQVDAAATTKALLADLRAAGRLWDWAGHHGRHDRADDPGKKSGKAFDAVWRGDSKAGKSGNRVVLTGRGHATSSAGHHGYGHHGGSNRSGGHGGFGHR